MKKLEQAARQALDALEMFAKHYSDGNEAIAALREVLAEQAEQEPVAWRWPTHNGYAYAETHFDDEGGEPLYAAPVRTKDLTDVADLQDAVTKALKKAFHLGQTYCQQADSESYAANKRANVTQELYWKLEGDTRAVIAADREKNK